MRFLYGKWLTAQMTTDHFPAVYYVYCALLFVAFFDMNFYDLSLLVINRSYDHFFRLSLVGKLMLVTSDTEKNMLFLLSFR